MTLGEAAGGRDAERQRRKEGWHTERDVVVTVCRCWVCKCAAVKQIKAKRQRRADVSRE